MSSSSTLAEPYVPPLDLSPASEAILDAKHALAAVVSFLHPSPDTIKARYAKLDTLTTATAKSAPLDTTQGAIRQAAVNSIEFELAHELARLYDVAERAARRAVTITAAHVNALDEIPDYVPRFTANTRSGTEHQVEVLRTELKLDRLRAELREYSAPELLTAYRDAHEREDWLLAHAADMELRRALRVGPNRRGLPDSPTAILDTRARISRELDYWRTQRRQRISPNFRQMVDADKAMAERLAGEVRTQGLVVAEVKKRQRFALPERR